MVFASIQWKLGLLALTGERGTLQVWSKHGLEAVPKPVLSSVSRMGVTNLKLDLGAL